MLVQTSLLLAEGAAGNPLTGMLPFVLMIGVFYFLVMRPMKKQEDERKQRLAELKRGDKIVLTGGLLGRISKVEDDIVIVEIADRVKVRVLKKDVADFEDNALKKDDKDKKDEKKAESDDEELPKSGKKGKKGDKSGDEDDSEPVSRRVG